MKRDNQLLHGHRPGHGHLTPNKARLILKQARQGFAPAIRYYMANRERIEELAQPRHDQRRERP